MITHLFSEVTTPESMNTCKQLEHGILQIKHDILTVCTNKNEDLSEHKQIHIIVKSIDNKILANHPPAKQIKH